MRERRREILLTVAAIAIVTAAIVRANRPPLFDQIWLLSTSLADGVPPFESGMSSRGLAVLTKVIAPADPAAQNTGVRTIAAGLAIAAFSGALLAAGATFGIWALCLALFVSSGLPLLWVSPDVVAAAGIALVCACAWRRARFLTLAPCGLLLSLARPDLLLPGVVLTFGAIAASRRFVVWKSLAFAFGCAAIVAASFSSPQHSFQRTTMSFGQHYAFLAYGDTDANAFENWRQYRDRDFGNDATWRDAWQTNPARYLDFVRRSIVTSASVVAQDGRAIVLALALWAAWRLRREPIARASLAFVALSVATITLLAFMHHRYLLRFFVLGLLLVARALTIDDGTRTRVGRWLVVPGLVALLGWQLLSFPDAMLEGMVRVD